jgi:1-acyl-sn-glycerol-3-phosphate acyltransferase
MRILEDGNILAVFPEGTRSPDGLLQAAKDGAAVLAARSGATIVPIGVGESDRLWPKGHKLPRRTPRVTIRIGAPFTLAGSMPPPTTPAVGGETAPIGASRRASNAAATDLIMRRIAALLPPRQRGAYGDEPAG